MLDILDNVDQEVSSEPDTGNYDIASMGEEEFKKIVFQVGLRLASSTVIPKEQEHKNAEGLKKLDLETYFETFDPGLCSLLEGLTSGKKRRGDIDLYQKAKVAEYIVHLLHPNTILSLCFMENLLMYNATNSKQAVNLLGDSGPYGHYHAVKDWLSNQSMKPLPYPDNDCVAIFDNNQVIGRSWKIKVNNKVQSSVVTTICQIAYPSYNLQRQVNMKPKFWDFDVEKLKRLVRDMPNEVSDIHYKQLYNTLAKNLQIVISQQKLTENMGMYEDNVDVEVERQRIEETTKVCSSCGHINGRSKRISGNERCKTNLKQAELSSEDPDGLGTFTTRKHLSVDRKMSKVRMTAIDTGCGQYIIQGNGDQHSKPIASRNPETIPVLSLSDPCFVNPNSYKSVRAILRQIGVQAGIRQYSREGDREWLFVVCDGLPFGLCQHVIRNTYRCKLCPDSSDSFNSKKDFRNHHESLHLGLKEEEFLEFEWVILRPGNGHFEMNMCKTFVELNWDVFFSELSRVMGFRSENAQRAAKKCSDHHKTWTLLQIAHEGNLQELMVPYVRQSMLMNNAITPAGFLKFMMTEAKNPNFIYLGTMTLTYLEALQNFRTGLRVGDIERIASSKAVFAPLFHARHHPNYQEIEMMEAVQRHSVPEELLPFYNETEAVCLSEDGESGK